MTKNRCKMCELMTEERSGGGGGSGSARDASSQPPRHPASLDRPNRAAIGAATINYPTNLNYLDHGLLSGLYLPQLLKDPMLPAYLLRGYYQPAGPLIQHPQMLPPVKAPPPEPTPTPPHNSEGSDDLVATSTTPGGGTTTNSGGGGFYRAYCPQYYGTPPQYQELCYPPSYPHPHSHPPPYYKYAPTYRRQYYGYPGGEGGGGTGGVAGGGGGVGGAAPGVVEYQPPQPGEYPMLPYYGAYPPPPPPLPPPPNPAYLHAQGRAIVDHAAFQGCPCPMQSCPKNVDTGPLIGNGKGVPVASGPGLSLPPSALVGPPSPARGLAGLAPPHGANAWDTDRVQLDTHRGGGNLDSQARQRHSTPASSSVHGIVADIHPRGRLSDSRTKNDLSRAEEKLAKCTCQKRACTSTCEVKLEAPSPTEAPSSAMPSALASAVLVPATSSACRREKTALQDFKLENNNVKCESCSVGIPRENISCSANCNVKCETGYNCEIVKCEECAKEGEMRMMELEKESGIRLMDEKRLDIDPSVKEELNDSILVDARNWQKPDYEPIVQDNPEDRISEAPENVTTSHRQDDELPECRRLAKRKLSLDSLSEVAKKRKVDKRTLSLGSTRGDCRESGGGGGGGGDDGDDDDDDDNHDDDDDDHRLGPRIVVDGETLAACEAASKKSSKKDTQKRKSKETTSCEIGAKRARITKSPTTTVTTAAAAATAATTTSNGLKTTATESSINETIDDVIQQSLKMSENKKIVGEQATEQRRGTSEIFVKKKECNVIPTMKKGSRKLDSARVAIGEKSSLAKSNNEANKLIAKEARCKMENKLGGCKRPKMSADLRHKSADSSKAKILPDTRAKESTRKLEIGSKSVGLGGSWNLASGKNRFIEISDSFERAVLVKKKRKSTKTSYAKRVAASANAVAKQETSGGETVTENCGLAKRSLLKPKWSNGWSWEGDSYEAKVYLTNEKSAIRLCYASMKHASGDVLRPRDCVLLKSGQRKADLPFVAKIAALWENPDDGEMMFSLLWYYRPEHTEQGRTDYDTEDEVFASRHRDANSVACIEDKCYILTFNEYCRYRKTLRRIDEGLESPGLIVPPGEQTYPRESRQPPIPVSADMVLFCRRVYDYRGKKLVKNPG